MATKAQGSAENAALQESIRLSARYTAAIKMLQGLNVQPAAAHTGDAGKGTEALAEIEDVQQQIQQVAHKLQAVEKELVQLEPWGDFDPKSVARLRDAGYQIDFISALINSSRRNGSICIMQRKLIMSVQNCILLQ